jgi:hypothetical protein
MNTAIALSGVGPALQQTERRAESPPTEAVGPFTGLTLAQAEDCLDWLENHGYTGGKALPDGDLWTVMLEAMPPLPPR